MKILIKDTQPDEHLKSVALDQLSVEYKVGKINPKILKVLFKVVIDDTEYEISCVLEYVSFLEDQIKRLKLADKYYTKMENAKKEKDKAYYLEGVKELLEQGETIDNFKQVYEEYKQALVNRKKVIQDLYDEIKIIKKLRI